VEELVTILRRRVHGSLPPFGQQGSHVQYLLNLDGIHSLVFLQVPKFRVMADSPVTAIKMFSLLLSATGGWHQLTNFEQSQKMEFIYCPLDSCLP
jgi:hypothetical protein